jgi:hypothetical protein
MTRSTIFLLAILVALVGATVWVMQRPGEQSSSGENADVLVSYDSAAVDRMDVLASSGTVSLTREGDAWMIASPIRARADQRLVAAAIGQGRSLRLKTLVSSNPAKQQLFQIDSSSALVRMFAKGSEVAAFHVGKPGPTYTETYIRREGSKDVFLTDGMLSMVFAKPARDWRNKALLSLRPEDVRSVQFQFGDTTFALSRADSMWQVDGMPASEYVVRGFLASLTSMQCDDFIDTTLAAMPPREALLEVNGVQLAFHRKPGDAMYTVIASTGLQVYTMYAWRAEQVLKRRQDFVSH